MIQTLSRRQIAAVALVLVLAVGGVAGYSALFVGGAGTSYETPSGLEVSTSVDHDVAADNPFPDDETVYIDGVRVSASSSSDLTVDQFGGSTTAVSSVATNGTTITVNPDDKSAVDISGGVTALSWEDAAIDGTAQLTYSASGSGTIVIDGLAADTDYAAATTGGDVLTTGTTTSSGEATIDVSSGTDVQVVLLEPSAPTLDDSSASPDGKRLTDSEVTLSIDATDADFTTDAGDEVNVTFETKAPNESSFSTIGSETLTGNGTASTSLTADVGGTWEWRAVATDAYGESVTSETFEFDAPADLELRNVTDANELLDGENATAEVTFFGESGIYTRETDNGIVSMDGLPNDERFVVNVDIDGFYQRTVIIDSLYEQQAAYMLPEDAPSAEIVWELDDRSGRFAGNNPTLTVEAPITRDFDDDGENETEYRVIAGQEFSATEDAVMNLRTDERLRLRISNDEGDERILGSYTPTADSLEPIVIKGIRFSGESRDSYATQVDVTNPDDAKRELTWSFRDPAEATTDLEIRIETRSNGTVAFEDSVDGPLGNYSTDVPLENDTSYVINWTATRNGETIGQTRPVAGNNLGITIPLDSQWLGTIGVVFVAFVGTLAGREFRTHMALAMVAIAGVLMLLQAVTIWVPLWWLGLTIAGGAHLRYIQNKP